MEDLRERLEDLPERMEDLRERFTRRTLSFLILLLERCFLIL